MADTPTTESQITIPPTIRVGEYAERLGKPVTAVIGELMKNGVMATINEQIDFDTAAIIGSDLGFEIVPEPEAASTAADFKQELPEGEGELRPPVVAVMGHVDHGKTSLLDAIRQTEVAAGESGGITQHIGAYQIKRGDRWITFLDTPGHEAFSALRAHGARMTDVAIIVVAADDGVRPQTREAIQMAQEAGGQIVIAINKVDKEGADPVRVRQELAEMGLNPEEWGGKTVMVDVSAKTGLGIDKLLDLVLLVADLEDLRARMDGPADGVIVESHLDAGRGPVVSVLVRNGRLKTGSIIVAGGTYAKVRNLEDWKGKRIKEAHPGMPAVVTGFKAVPAFGDLFTEVDSEKSARELATKETQRQQTKSLTNVKKIDASRLSEAITAAGVKELNLVVKADVQGSLESLLESLGGLHNEEVAAKIVSSGVGDITESDISFAATAHALVLGFNVTMSSTVRQLANRDNVHVQSYKVIYELLGDVREALSGMLSPEIVETSTGELEVLGVFKITKQQVVCGGKVTHGKVEKGVQVRVLRGKDALGQGVVGSVQRDKQEAKEASEGELCGLNLDLTGGLKMVEGDKLEFFTTEERTRTL